MFVTINFNYTKIVLYVCAAFINYVYFCFDRQRDLFQVLKAYSILNSSVGYCQAQAPLAAFLLMHMPAEQAFWCLVSICDKYLGGYYSQGMVSPFVCKSREGCHCSWVSEGGTHMSSDIFIWKYIPCEVKQPAVPWVVLIRGLASICSSLC